MAFQNEEDYLDNLLKSITEKKESVSADALFTTDSNLQVPETFETPVENEKNTEEEDIYQKMRFDDINPMAAMFSSDKAENWNEMTVNDVLEQEERNGQEEPPEPESQTQAEHQEESEDELIDQYIQKVLTEEESKEEAGQIEQSEQIEEPVEIEQPEQIEPPVEIEQPEQTEPPTQYIDITENESEGENHLINMLDDIFTDVENEIQQSQQAAENFVDAQQEVQEKNDEEVDFSNIPVDDELRELLGTDGIEEQEEGTLSGLSEEELKKLENLQNESDSVENGMEEAISYSEEGEDKSAGITELLNQIADAGIDVNSNSLDAGNESEKEQSSDNKQSLAQIPEKKAKEKDAGAKKSGLLGLLLGIFKKKEKQEQKENVNENQQVLDELFDENGELLGKEKKVKKKGLFSKSKKNNEVETPIAGGGEPIPEMGDIPELEDIPELGKKEKKKKEKKKKEPKEKKVKEKKPKKPKQPKIKKEKAPVNPSELISIKPVVIIIMLVIIVGITGYVYFFIHSFSYEQALDQATYYLVDKKYQLAYEAIAGIEPKNEEDTALKEQITTIMYVQKQYNSYERYLKMKLSFEALDSLIKGIKEYDVYYGKAEELGVSGDLDNVKELILTALRQYGISEAMARSYGAITDYEQYVYILESYGGIVQ